MAVEAAMPITVTIENVPDEVIQALRRKAAQRYHSMQDELMAMLEDAARMEISRSLTIKEITALADNIDSHSVNEITRMIREDRDR